MNEMIESELTLTRLHLLKQEKIRKEIETYCGIPLLRLSKIGPIRHRPGASLASLFSHAIPRHHAPGEKHDEREQQVQRTDVLVVGGE